MLPISKSRIFVRNDFFTIKTSAVKNMCVMITVERRNLNAQNLNYTKIQTRLN